MSPQDAAKLIISAGLVSPDYQKKTAALARGGEWPDQAVRSSSARQHQPRPDQRDGEVRRNR